jgi:arabinofuranosyltransferase
MKRDRAAWFIVAGTSALLFWLARRYDFFCDDAFITLRYAQNVAHGAGAVYNAGERVEGYTSLTWMLLAALFAKLGLPLPGSVQVLGALAGIGLLTATFALWRRLHPERPAFGALALAAVAVSAPTAAWTMGGLETPLFSALLTWAVVLASNVASGSRRSHACALGVVLGAATLTRPEGMLVSGALGVPLAVLLARDKAGRVAFALTVTTALAIVGAHVAWRMHYYGYPLPNTFYVKSSGDTLLLCERGLRYVAFAASELGPALLAAILFGVLAPVRESTANADVHDSTTASAQRGRSAIVWTARLLLPAYVAYVVVIGGDFLDLYRFFAPLLPLALVLATSALLVRVESRSNRTVAVALGAVLLAGHAVQQERLARRALQVAEPDRGARGIEPLGWTKLYALRWAATGRWIAAHADQGDWMAVGAAGAMPYYAGIANLDTFGLCDAWVAHEGPIVGNRPGHQRFAPESYILSKHPAFLLIGNDYTSDQPRPLRRDRKWEQRGYVWAEARIDAEHFGAPSTFYHYLLMRLDRARQHAGSAWLRFEPRPTEVVQP